MSLLFFSKIALLLLILIIPSKSVCQNSNQTIGECSNCSMSQRLVDGYCYPQIIGCLYYKSATKCLVCSNNYIQIGPNCFQFKNSSSIFQNSIDQNHTDFSTSKGNSILSNQSSIDQQKLDTLWKYLQQKHPQLQGMKSSITEVYQMISVYSRVFLFKCMAINQAMRIQASIDYKDNITQLTYMKIPSLTTNILDNTALIQINKFIKQEYSADLNNTVLLKIQSVVANLFKFHYYSEFGKHFISFIQKSPFLEIKKLQSIQDALIPTNIVDFVYSQYPQFLQEANYTVKQISKYPNSIFEVIFASRSNVILEVEGSKYYTLVMDQMNQSQNSFLNTINPYQFIANTTFSKIVGAYQKFNDTNDSIFMATIKHLFQQYQYLQSAQITKIQYQIVSGTNFIIYLTEPVTQDEYVCKVFYSLSGYINVMEIYRNSNLIETDPLAPPEQKGYDYTKDSQFSLLIAFLNTTYGIKMPLPYSYVNKVLKSDKDGQYYNSVQIVSNSKTFLIVNYNNISFHSVALQQYIVNGQSQLQDNLLSNQIISLIQKTIQNYKNWMNPLIVQYIRSTKPKQYIAKIITSYGSFFLDLIETSNGLQIDYFQLLNDHQFCLTHTIYNYSTLDFLINYSKLVSIMQGNTVNLSGTSLVTLSEAILNESLWYRLLFVDLSNMKQIQVILQYDSISEAYLIKNSTILNQGYYHLNNITLYNKILQKSYNTFLAQLINYKPVFSQQNSTNVRIYLAGYSLNQQKNRTQSILRYTQSLIDGTFQLKTIFSQNIGNCTKFDNVGYCSVCPSGQIAFYSQCYNSIKGCQNQVGNVCLQCQNSYTLINNSCINDCSQLI